MSADQPAGARQVMRVTALVEDLDHYCPFVSWEVAGRTFPVSFGPAFELPELGARACEVTLVGGSLRFLMPTRPDGLAAAWFADGGPRWMGFTLAVEDLDLATRTLERRGVTVLRLREGARRTAIVEPQAAGGTIMELVETPVP